MLPFSGDKNVVFVMETCEGTTVFPRLVAASELYISVLLEEE